MTTVADIALKVAQLVTDMQHGAATAGTTTSLTDSVGLIQNNQYWDRGTLWVRSGANSGKVIAVTGHAGNKLSFASLGATSIAPNDLYSVIRSAYPWNQIVNSITQALDDTHVTAEDSSLIGDGTTLEFTLPAGVYNIKRVEFKRTNVTERLISTHWKEQSGKIRWDYGYPPRSGDEIHVIYRDQHPILSTFATEINTEISEDWLRLKAAEYLLIWGASQYGKNPEYMIEERMNIILGRLKGKTPRIGGLDIIVKTAGQ